MNFDTYIPYGPEWKLEVKRMTKDQIIDNLLLPALKKLSSDRLQEIIMLHWMIDKGYNFNDHKLKILAYQEINNLTIPIEHPNNKTALWFPSDLPPKDSTIVLGEDAEGCSYIVKFIDGTPRQCGNVMECEHPDHNQITDGKCREMKEGFYEVLEQFLGEHGYVEVRREIVRWRSIPKSN